MSASGLMPRQPDRRQAPRRREDLVLHVATLGVVSAALAVVDAEGQTVGHRLAALEDLVAAAGSYRRAEEAQAAAWREPVV